METLGLIDLTGVAAPPPWQGSVDGLEAGAREIGTLLDLRQTNDPLASSDRPKSQRKAQAETVRLAQVQG